MARSPTANPTAPSAPGLRTAPGPSGNRPSAVKLRTSPSRYRLGQAMDVQVHTIRHFCRADCQLTSATGDFRLAGTQRAVWPQQGRGQPWTGGPGQRSDDQLLCHAAGRHSPPAPLSSPAGYRLCSQRAMVPRTLGSARTGVCRSGCLAYRAAPMHCGPASWLPAYRSAHQSASPDRSRSVHGVGIAYHRRRIQEPRLWADHNPSLYEL